MTPKSLGFKSVNVHFGTFDYTVHCIVGPAKHVQKYVRWKLSWPEIEWSGTSRGVCFYRDGWVPVIWIPRKPRTPREYSTLAHESLHAVRHMLEDWAGMSHTKDSDETYCHALGYCITSILEVL